MKKTKLFCGALTLLSAAAHAQSSVTLYGSLDEGVTYTSNIKGHGTASVGPVAVPDFFGLRGTEDLGGNWKAIFALQNGFLSSTGATTIAGEAFSHFAWVGLASPYGALTLGRQLDLTTETLRLSSDGALQYTFYLFHPANLDNIGIRGDSINNSIKYATPDFRGLKGAVLYGLDDTTTQPGHVVSANVTYMHGPLRASAVYSSWRNHAIDIGSQLGYGSFLGTSLTGGAVFNAKTQKIAGLSASYAIDRHLDVHAVLTQVNLSSVTQAGRMRNVEGGADIHFTPANTVTLGGYASWLTGTRYAAFGVGDIYALSPRTIVYAQAVYQHADGNGHAALALLAPSDSQNQTALRIGVHHFF
ncbi:porin [Caballeronia sp. LZ034LL]|uniref:porin n=1 Tax=Caballeronia sp. LZ034LL TaxID=3038567 RepID=UPI00285B5125|nr:porin [Caballeronia sp. LZ034LL]MDR5836060.1 porin [Caballeronia sp. LZ034LL]